MEFWFGFAFGLGFCFVFYKVSSCCFVGLFHGRFFYKEGQKSKEMNEHCL